MRYDNLHILALVAFLLFNIGCKKVKSPLENYDRASLLNSLADNVITPAYQSFSLQADSLYIEAETFNHTTNQDNLIVLIERLKKTIDAWQQCEVFNIEYAKNNSVNSQIASFPANESIIESEISGTNNIDESYIESTGTTRKGLSAVEYLLLGNGGSIFTNQQLFINSERRKIYLLALCAHIKTVARNLKNEWNNGNSYNHFITQTQMDISGSLNTLINTFVEHIEFVRRNKLGKPCGIEHGTTADFSKLESRYLPHSTENIRINIESWKKLFTSSNNSGIDDYADAIGAKYNEQKLSFAILNQLESCAFKANALSSSLEDATKNNINDVKALHLELKKLTVLTKVDLSSSLGVVVTFSDNDGD